MSGMKKASEQTWEKWSGIIAAQRDSGLSAARFCAERGIWASSFFAWKRKLSGAAKRSVAASGFVEATVGGVDDERGGGVAIELSRGRRVSVKRGFDRRLLLEVIEALESGWGGAGGGS